MGTPVWELEAKGDTVLARGRTWVRARTGLPAVSPEISFFFRGDTVLAGRRLLLR